MKKLLTIVTALIGFSVAAIDADSWAGSWADNTDVRQRQATVAADSRFIE